MNDSSKTLERAALALDKLLLDSGHAPVQLDLDAAVGSDQPGVDELFHAAQVQGVPLAEIEAPLSGVAEWLRRDVPLLAEARDPLGELRWLVLRRDGEGDVEVSVYDSAGSRTLHMAESELAQKLGLAVGVPLRWVRVETSRVAAAAVGGSDKSSEPLPPLKRLFALLNPDRRDLFAVAIFAIGVGVLLLATPIAVQAIVNFVALGGAVPPLIVVSMLLFMGLCAAGVLTAMQTWVVEILQRRLFVRAVADIARRLPRVSHEAEDGRYMPELVNRFFDLETIQKRGSFLLLDGLSVLLSVTVGLAVLAFYHPVLLAFDLGLLVIIGLIVLGPVRRGTATAKAESSAKYEMAAWLEEVARNPVLFKSSGVSRTVTERTDLLARQYIDRRQVHFRVAFGQGVAAIVLQVVANVALLGIGGLLVIRGSLTLGQLVAAELILALVVNSVAKLGKHLEAYYDLMAATAKVGMLLDLPVERDRGEHHLPGRDGVGAAVAFSSVGWAPPGGPSLFDGATMEVAPGEHVGVRGPSGSGKSTLLRMAWGLLAPSRGSLTVDGRDVRELSLESLRRTANLVDRVELMDGSLRDNVTLGRPFVSDEDVRGALRRVGLLDELARLPQGLDTPVTSDGRPLSTGQAVRMQVARAVACRPRLLLVSDVFGLLEADERNAVLDVLFDRSAPWTLIFVTNHADALGLCDRTYRLDGSLRQDPPTSPEQQGPALPSVA